MQIDHVQYCIGSKSIVGVHGGSPIFCNVTIIRMWICLYGETMESYV